jgi:Holliday junction resolvase RusA-like endonuclease
MSESPPAKKPKKNTKACAALTDYKFVNKPSHIHFTVNNLEATMKCRIDGTPRPLYRARGKDSMPTDNTWYWNPSKANQESLANAIKKAIDTRTEGNPFSPESGNPVSINCKFYLPRPKNHYDIRHGHGLLPDSPAKVTKTPDLDNLVKLLLDALQGIIYHDDKVVTSIQSSKHYLYQDVGRVYFEKQNEDGCMLLLVTEHKSNSLVIHM